MKIAFRTSSADFQYRADDDKTTSNKFWGKKTRTPSAGLGAKQSGINPKTGVALPSVRRPLAETKISRECARSYTEEALRVDDTVRIAKN